jgi:hypothetical protein
MRESSKWLQKHGAFYKNMARSILARVQAQGKNSGPASKARYFVKRPFS